MPDQPLDCTAPFDPTLGLLLGLLESGGNLIPMHLSRCRDLPAVRTHAAALGLCRPGEFTAVTVTAIVDLVCVRRGVVQRDAFTLPLSAVAAFLAEAVAGRGSGKTPAEKAPRKTGRERRKRGRPTNTDAEKDRRIREAWQSGEYTFYADLARALDISEWEVRAAIDRQRHRPRPKREDE
jgi:hypothetical protein